MLTNAFTKLAVTIGLLVIGLLVYGLINRTPITDMQFARVDRDTTFYIGKASSHPALGGQLSVRATGTLYDSTAVLSLEYTDPVASSRQIKLAAGNVDTLMTGDFYDQRAKVIYRHNHVQQGRLRLQAVFSWPPEEWPFRLRNDRWVRVN